ncbi:MAG: TonB-dependent receptor [Burkholderiales bacterium]|nr:TonB-dependent receptor [Burkholderiales bacterium]
MSLSSRRFAAVIAVVFPFIVHAQTPAPTTLPAVAVTAARSPQQIADLLADLTVIGHDEILRSGVQSLPELLQRQPGVEITMNGGPGSTSGAFLRGANRGQTLVLVDGLRVGSSSVGATSLEAIPLDQIERIEILRGPASSLYGADAIGGVIQIFTRKADGGAWTANASAGYGTYATRSANGGLRGSMGPLAFSAQFGGTRSDGFNAIVDPANFSYNGDRDGYRRQNASANGVLTWAQDQEVAVQYFYNRLNAQYDGGPGFDDRTITTLEAWSVASRNRLTDRWSSNVSIGSGSDDSLSQTGFGDFPFKTTQRQYAWQNDFTLPLGALAVIAERREERLATDQGFAVTDRNTNSFTGVYRLRHDAFAFQGNLRYDRSNQYGGETTGSATAGYRIDPAWRLTAGYSTGFKAPSFNDLYYPFFSNPNLVPEKARNTEVGVYWTPPAGAVRLAMHAVGYYNRIDDLIVFACDVNFVCLPNNIDKATLKGVTAGLDGTWRETRVKASLDLQDPKDDHTGNLLPRRARQHGALQVLQQVGPVQAGVEYVASAARYDDAANLVRMGGYGIVNVTLDWVVAKGWSLFARGNNVFDKNYELAAGYATGGAQFFAGVRYQP